MGIPPQSLANSVQGLLLLVAGLALAPPASAQASDDQSAAARVEVAQGPASVTVPPAPLPALPANNTQQAPDNSAAQTDSAKSKIRAGHGLALTLSASMLGFGVEGVYGLGRYFDLRGQLNGFQFSQTVNDDGIRYTGKLRLLTEGALLEWHPLAGRLRISAGAYNNGDRIGLKSLCAGSGCNLHEFTIANNGTQDPEIDGAATFHRFAPYAGLGFGDALYGSRWQFAVDVGVLDQGSPAVSLSAHGSATIVNNANGTSTTTPNLGTDPEVAAALADEQQRAQSGIDHYRLYPVISLALGYRFNL